MLLNLISSRVGRPYTLTKKIRGRHACHIVRKLTSDGLPVRNHTSKAVKMIIYDII